MRIGVNADTWDKKLMIADMNEVKNKCMQIFIKFVTKFDQTFNANFLYVKVYFQIFDL